MNKILLSAVLTFSATMVAGAANPFLNEFNSKKIDTGFSMRNKVHSSIPGRKAAPAGEAESVITTPPAGVRTEYSNRGDAYFSYDNGIYLLNFDFRATHFVECDNGDVYIYNPISQVQTATYIKGHREGDVITLQFPQMLYQERESGVLYTYYVNKMQQGKDEVGEWMFVDEDDNTLQLVLEDGEWMLDLPTDKPTIMGMTDDEFYWMGFGEGDVIFTPFNEKLVELPEGLETERWAFSQGGEGRFINVAFDNANNAFYAQGMFKKTPEAWAKGDIEGDKVIFKSKQYMGEAEYYYGFLMGYEMKDKLNPALGTIEKVATLVDETVFNYDRETNTISTTGLIALNVGYEFYASMEDLKDTKFSQQKELTSYVPMKPTLVSFLRWNEEYGYYGVRFMVPMLNLDSQVLDPDNMYYCFYYDGVPHVVEPGPYTSYDPMFEIPFMFTDGFDIWVNENLLSEHYVFMYDNDFKVLGIQSIYKHNGESYKSEILSIDNPTSVEGIDDSKEIVSEEWYDLNGCRVSKPTNGIFVKVVTFDDNTRKTFKEVVK